MFRKQFSLIAQEKEAFKELCVFAIQVHIEAWFTVSKATEAPHRGFAFKSILQLSKEAFSIPHLKRCLNIYGICIKQWFSTCGPWPTGGPQKYFAVGHRAFWFEKFASAR